MYRGWVQYCGEEDVKRIWVGALAGLGANFGEEVRDPDGKPIWLDAEIPAPLMFKMDSIWGIFIWGMQKK